MDMAKGNSKILTAEQEIQLRQPIEDHVGKIQTKIDSLRADGIDKVISLQNKIDSIKRDRNFNKQEKEAEIAKIRGEMEKAKAVEAKNKDEISRLIADAETYLKAHFDKDYYEPVKESCVQEKAAVQEKHRRKIAELEREHQEILS